MFLVGVNGVVGLGEVIQAARDGHIIFMEKKINMVPCVDNNISPPIKKQCR
jgi:hypothetical protein